MLWQSIPKLMEKGINDEISFIIDTAIYNHYLPIILLITSLCYI